MTTLQEYLNEKYTKEVLTSDCVASLSSQSNQDLYGDLYGDLIKNLISPDVTEETKRKIERVKKEVKEINITEINKEREGQGITKLLEGDELDLSEYTGLEKVLINGSYLLFPLTKITLGNNSNLTELDCSSNRLTSVDFLNQLTNPEKLTSLHISDNNIETTDIAVFSKFVSLEELRIGTTKKGLKKNKNNKFYGSLKAFENLSKLEDINIEATDIDSGLEYLPSWLAEITAVLTGNEHAKKSLNRAKEVLEIYEDEIACSSHDTKSKCSVIYNELKIFNFNLKAWQLAHPEKMLIARPELFTNPDSKDKWLETLNEKIRESKETLNYITQNQADKTAKIARLETQIKILEKIENQLREEIEEERAIHTEVMKVMDNFYRQNLLREDLVLQNILQQFEKKYLQLNRENKQKEQKIKELKRTIKTIEKIVEQEYQPKETKEQETQTELTGEELQYAQIQIIPK